MRCDTWRERGRISQAQGALLHIKRRTRDGYDGGKREKVPGKGNPRGGKGVERARHGQSDGSWAGRRRDAEPLRQVRGGTAGIVVVVVGLHRGKGRFRALEREKKGQKRRGVL